MFIVVSYLFCLCLAVKDGKVNLFPVVPTLTTSKSSLLLDFNYFCGEKYHVSRNIHLILRKYHLSSLPPHSLHFSFYLGPAYFFFKKYLFIWLCLVLGSSLHHVGFFIVVHGLSVCGEGTSCFEAHVILVPQPGMEPASPALQCGFLITGASPGKSPPYSYK